MDLIKIGNFISECRKEKNLTQQALADKLYITDRAVSKWERGISLPDAGKMIELCNILGITVNELLIGEKIDMKNKKTEELLIEMKKTEEIQNKKLITTIYITSFITIVFYLAMIILAKYTINDELTIGIIVVVSSILLIITLLYNFKIENEIGYYECKNCHNKFKPNYITSLNAPHVGTTRHLRCPKCNKKTWAKKVMNK